MNSIRFQIMLCWVRGGRFRFHNKQTKKVDSGPFDFHCRLLQFLKNENVESHQHSGRWFCLLNLRLPSGIAFGEIARWQAGAQTWTQTWTRPPDQRVVKVLKPPKSQHSKLCGVWILFKYVTDTKFEPSEVTFLRLMPRTAWGNTEAKFKLLDFRSCSSCLLVLRSRTSCQSGGWRL